MQQRPDIRAAEAQLHSASAQIGVATANLLPQVNITGTNFGWTATKLSHLFKETSVFWAMITNVVQPIFDGGALLSKRDGALAAFDQACAYISKLFCKGSKMLQIR